MSHARFSVLLLRPDYVAEQYGTDTYLAHVTAQSVDDAIEAARREVVEVDSPTEAGQAAWPYTVSPNDYHVLLVAKGFINDLSTGA